MIGASACAHSATVREHAARDEHERPAPHLQASVDAQSHPAHARSHAVPVVSPGATNEVALEALLAYADLHSPVLSVARSTRSRADAARVAASPSLPANPDLTLAAGPRFGSGGTGLDLQASLMQQIEIAGERGLRTQAADRLHDLTDAEIEQIRWSVHCDVHAMFHRAVVERERAQLAQRVVAFQQEVLRVVERQIAAGEAAPFTLRLAQAEVAQAKQLQVLAEQTLNASRIRLGQLAGWPSATAPNPSGGVDEPREPPPYDKLLQVAREQLPSLRAGTAAIREAEARVTLADRERWVRPSIGVQYTREGSRTNEPATNILLGVVSMPIPGFQTNHGARAHARADVIVANAELAARSFSIEGEIAAARSEVVAAAQRTSAYGTEILPRIEENLTLLRRSFELGEIDILSLSVGRERFLRIQSDAFAAQLDYFVALAALERVVGVDLWHDHLHEGATP